VALQAGTLKNSSMATASTAQHGIGHSIRPGKPQPSGHGETS
jgi:hypothetical protein